MAGAREEDMWRRAIACALVAGTDVRDLSDRAKDLLVAAIVGPLVCSVILCRR